MKAAPLHGAEPAEEAQVCGRDASLGRRLGFIHGGGEEAEPEPGHAGEVIYLRRLGNTSSFWRNLWKWPGGVSCKSNTT